jgi:protein-S-isoprenylcysteine O-methyltransferase Ste14
MFAVHFLVPGPALAEGFLTWVDLALVATGLWLNVVASRRFEEVGTPISPFTESTYLETGGVFARSRNPMDLGMVLILLGAALALGSTVPFLAVPAFAWLIERDFIVHEEAMLQSTFGDAYLDYAARVCKWI